MRLVHTVVAVDGFRVGIGSHFQRLDSKWVCEVVQKPGGDRIGLGYAQADRS